MPDTGHSVRHLVPVWIVYVDGERLDPMYEGALERIVVDDQLDGVGSAVLEFDSGAEQIRDSGVFALESQVSVYLGYKDDCAQVFAGEVTEFRVDFSADGHDRIKVVCRNCLYKLQNAYQSRAFEEKRVSDALKERLESYGLKGNIEPFGAVKHYFVENGVTDYEYLMQNAKKYGKTVYAYEDTVYIQDEVTISEEEVILEWGKSVISFRCSENLKGQLSGCVFTGWDELKCEGITGRAELADIAVKVGGEHTWKDNGKGAGGNWESVFSADDVYDSEDAKQRAAGYLQNRSMEYQTGAVKCEGNRHIFPGMRITVKNVGDYFLGEYIAERVVHELSVSRGFTTEVYVKRNMTAGGANHVPGAELAEQEGAGNTETEQTAGEEGDERVALYEEKADDTVAAGEETVHSEAASADEENQTEEELLYGFGKIDSNYRGWVQQDRKWAKEPLAIPKVDDNNENGENKEDDDENNTMAKQGCKVIAAAKILCTIMGNEDFAPLRFIAAENRIVDSDGNLSKEAIVKALEKVKSAPEVKPDYFEKQLNEATLNTLKNDPENVNYILGRAHIGGGIGQHWVVIEDYTVLPDGTLEYQVVRSSKNDEGRIFRSDPDFATDDKKAYINKIEVFSVRRK